MKTMPRKVTFIIIAVSFCVLVAGMAWAIGMRVQPGGALIQAWPLGEKRELPTPLVIFNDDIVERTMTVAALKPSALNAELISGYSDLPDTAWMSFQPAAVNVPPKGHAAVRMCLAVPQDTKYLNQHWSFNLAVRSSHGKGQQIGIAVYPRFEIETRASAAATAPHGPLVITPSLVIFEKLRPGGEPGAAPLRIWNNTQTDMELSATIYSQPQKGKRPVVTLSGGQSWIPDTAWLQPNKTSLTVKAGKFTDINLCCNVPPGVRYGGGAWEAILLAVTKDGQTAFARIRLTTIQSSAK